MKTQRLDRSPPSSHPGKTFYPPKTIDDDLEDLDQLIDTNGWGFLGAAAAQLHADAEAQRRGRAEHEALRSQWLALHERFGLAQLARYQRYLAILSAMRGMFREDKAALAELDRFKRRRRPRKPTTEAEAA